MRFLDANAMLCLLPADAGVTDQALARLNPLFSAFGGDRDRLPSLVSLGLLRTAQINHEGVPVAVVWFRTERERLIVDTLSAVSTGRNTDAAWAQIWAGVNMLAHTHGCNVVEGVTRRAALARVYQRNGFEPVGVVMRKRCDSSIVTSSGPVTPAASQKEAFTHA